MYTHPAVSWLFLLVVESPAICRSQTCKYWKRPWSYCGAESRCSSVGVILELHSDELKATHHCTSDLSSMASVEWLSRSCWSHTNYCLNRLLS